MGQQRDQGESEFKVEGGETEVRPAPEPDRPPPFLTGRFKAGARTVITREKFKDTQKTVADVLEDIPGLSLTRSGDDLSPTRVTIRGSRSNQVLILLDGFPLGGEQNEASARGNQGRGGLDLAGISLSRVESIEVVRGAASGLYGPGAAAGVIIIRTRRPEKPVLVVAGTVGSHGFLESDFFWNQPLEAGGGPESSLGLHFNFRKTKGRYIYYDPDGAAATNTTPSGAQRCSVPQGGGYFERRCNEKTIATLELDWRRGREGRISALLEAYRREGLGGVENPRPFGREKRRRFRLGYEDGIPLSGGSDSETDPESAPEALGWKLHLERLSSQRIENTTMDQSNHPAFDDGRFGGEAWWERWRERAKLRIGGAVSRQVLDDRAFRAERNTYAIYAAWTLNRDAGTLETALRHDRLSGLDAVTTGRAAFSEALYGGFGLKGSVATGYRPPTLYELHDPGAFSGDSVANPALRPENSISRDGGIFLEWGKWLFGEALYFRQDTTDNIISLPAPESSSLFRFENVSRTRSTGVEAALNLRFTSKFSMDAAWTRTRAVILENDAVDPRTNGKRVPGVPDRLWKVSMDWRRGGKHLWLQVRHKGTRYVDALNTIFLRPFTVYDGGISVSLGQYFQVSLEGRNLGNVTYAEKDNFPPPGRRGLLTLRWTPWGGKKKQGGKKKR
ncbi:MAG: TonB-dependent receptor [SAR324 cluster bacterium]|nr:TonB-dependent receptor [SAR324 cluster bacterium]MCH8885133.1 TonB-dependent receptor [SAR324 cluster bacterium]